MTFLSSRYQFDCILPNAEGEPLARFRRGPPDILETEFSLPLVETVLIDPTEVLRLLRLEKRPWRCVGRRPEVTRVLYADRECRLQQLEFAKEALSAWHAKPHRKEAHGEAQAPAPVALRT